MYPTKGFCRLPGITLYISFMLLQLSTNRCVIRQSTPLHITCIQNFETNGVDGGVNLLGLGPNTFVAATE